MFKRIFKQPEPRPVILSRVMAEAAVVGMAMGGCAVLVFMGVLEGIAAAGHRAEPPSLAFGVLLVVFGCVGVAGLMWAFNKITHRVEGRYSLLDTKADPTVPKIVS